MPTPIQPPSPGRPPRDPVDVLRTRLWLHGVKLRSGLSSAYAIERTLDGDAVSWVKGNIRRPRKWDAYEQGTRVPGAGRDDARAVEQAEAAWPGTARWFRHPLWRALKAAPMDMRAVEAGLLELEPAVVALLYEPVDPGRPLDRKQVAIDGSVADRLVALSSFDALAAAVLLARQSEAIASTALREVALSAYRALQPRVAQLPVVAPFQNELYGLADQRCKEWLYITPNRRLEVMLFWEGLWEHPSYGASPQAVIWEAMVLMREMAAVEGGQTDAGPAVSSADPD